MTYAAIQSLIYDYVKKNTTTLPVATLNLYTQPAEDRVAGLILQNDSKWQYDDANQTTTLPIDTQNLTANQQDYPLGTTYLSLDRVELLPNGANSTTGWKRLGQIDQQDFKNANSQSLTSYQSTAGTPLEYDLVGNSVFLYPAPNFTQANSLKFYYTRGPLKFDYSTGKFTDGTGSTASSPGSNSLFHELYPLYAAFAYATANGMEVASKWLPSIQRLEAELIEFYGLRDRDRRGRLTVSTSGVSGNESGRISYGGRDSNV